VDVYGWEMQIRLEHHLKHSVREDSIMRRFISSLIVASFCV